MRIFVTGATGYIGSSVVKDMILEGHEVVGLARSDEGEAKLRTLGAQPLRGDLTDLEILNRAAAAADAVAHLAFNQDLSQLAKCGQIEIPAIGAMGDALAGSGKSFVSTSGTGFIADGVVITEAMQRPDDEQLFRRPEQETKKLLAKGVKAMIVRVPQVYGPQNRSTVAALIRIAREKGYVAYVGEGNYRWPSAHRDDIARVYRLAIEKGQAGCIYHPVAEEGFCVRDLARIIAERLNLPLRSIPPEEANAYFGFVAMFATMDNPVSSAITRAALGWAPTCPTMFEDLRDGDYFDPQ